MSAHPMIDEVLGLNTVCLDALHRAKLATELRALLAERDAAKADAKFWREQESERKELCDAWKDRAEKAEADREKLADENETLRNSLPTPPTRKLREVKGVVYDRAQSQLMPWCLRGSYRFSSAAACVGSLVGAEAGLTDADHAPIYALKDDPYEPGETVEDIVRELAAKTLRQPDEAIADYVARLRAAVLAEPTRGEG